MNQLPQAAAVDNTIRGFWRLVASSTHGAAIKIETGFSSRYKESTTKEAASQFSSTATASAAVTVAAESAGASASATATVAGSVTAGGSSSIASTAASALSQSKKEEITVQCPDEQMTTKYHDTEEGYDPMDTFYHDSVSLEYVYQWVVGNAEYEAKTQHFRCHRSPDGKESPPQCAPQFCGDPFLNPYCFSASYGCPMCQEGADARCAR